MQTTQLQKSEAAAQAKRKDLRKPLQRAKNGTPEAPRFMTAALCHFFARASG